VKKIIISICSFFIVINAYSIPKDPCYIKETCCEKPIDTYAFSCTKKNETACPKNINLYADFLYMNSLQDIEYAYLIEKHPIENSLKNRPGIRIDLNTLLLKDFYLDVQWKYLNFKRESSIAFNDESIIALFLPPDDLNVMSNASSRIKGDVNTFDIRLVKSYCVSRYFTSSPAIGLRAALIDQNFLAEYFISNTKNTVINKNNFTGIGLIASYDGLFLIHKHVSFYANTLFSMLFSKFKISQHSNSSFSTLKYSVEENYYSVNPNTEISLGILLDHYYKHHRYKVAVKIGYEFHYWWNQVHLKKFMDPNPVSMKNISRNELSFKGFVAGLLVTF
jgi:hypothetical protein